MPLILSEKDPKFGHLILWNVTEDADFFEQALCSTSLDLGHINEWHPSRQKEWMTGRYLLHAYTKYDLGTLSINQQGKPSFPDPNFSFSISHTEELVGLHYHDQPIGLDLQIRTEKIGKVAHKFCSQNDYDLLTKCFSKEEAELIAWSIKESVFKAYGQGNLSYKNDIQLKNLEVTSTSKKFEVKIERIPDGLDISYIGRIRFYGPYCMSQVRQLSDLT